MWQAAATGGDRWIRDVLPAGSSNFIKFCIRSGGERAALDGVI